MRKAEFQNYKNIILSHFDDDAKAFVEQVEAYHNKNYKAPTLWHACRQMALDGFFACYYSQVIDDLKAVYGEDFDDTKYFTKAGDLRYKGGDVYAWTVYTSKMATAGEKLYNEIKNKQEK